MMPDLPVTLADIQAAAIRISGKLRHTPIMVDVLLSDRAGVQVFLKQEYKQDTGAFKLRGATNAVLSLPHSVLARGVVTASTGNHGRALAHAARAAGGRAVVCLSRLVPENKVAAVRALGAEVRIVGASQDEAMEEVLRAVNLESLTQIPPFDHADVVAGQGTLGLEILADCEGPATILVPLSGGGLAAGIAIAAKGLRPDVLVIGLSMTRGAAMAASLDAGAPVLVEERFSLADSLGGGIGLANSTTFAICSALLDEVILLSEAEIAAGMRHIHAVTGDAVEGAAAVGVAAILAGKIRATGPIVAIVSGCNIAPDLFARVMAHDLELEMP